MRKLILVLLCLTFIQGCSINGDELVIPEENVSEINFPKESEEFGKEVAKEIKGVVNNLNNSGCDFSAVNNNPVNRIGFYRDIQAASPMVKRTKSSAGQLQQFELNPIELAKKRDNLTAG